MGRLGSSNEGRAHLIESRMNGGMHGSINRSENSLASMSISDNTTK
jgi:hypothetical protein